MTAFVDTSVLVAVFFGDHVHHDASIARFVRLNKQNGATAAHCLAEVYAVLTGMPGKHRATPDQALLFLGDVRDRLSLVTLSAKHYADALSESSKLGIVGGGIYDVVVAHSALKAKASVLYTWNLKHFVRQGKAIAAIAKQP